MTDWEQARCDKEELDALRLEELTEIEIEEAEESRIRVLEGDDQKTCTKCNATKHWLQFQPSLRRADGRDAVCKACRDEQAAPGQRVYFLFCKSYIKIGAYSNLADRRCQLQIGNPFELVVLGTMNGGLAKEGELHKKFEHLLHRGEWYRITLELLDYIETCADTRPAFKKLAKKYGHKRPAVA
jgi:hypothetical protein